MSLQPASLLEIRDRVNRRECRAEEIVRDSLARVETLDPSIGAFLTVVADRALDDARRVDARVDGGARLPLAGVPLAVKDSLCVRGLATTCGSRILEGFHPPYTATAVERLREAGAVPIGKTNLDEFGMGSSNENSAFGPVRNPWDPDRVPGGSSGGSAAAVASGMVSAALGSDTGGSVRQPAAFCGVVGLKPTYGRVSRFGLIAFASSLDQIGPLARTVPECAAVLRGIAGADERDMTCAREPVPDYEARLEGDLRGLRIGIPREYLDAELPDGIAGCVRGALERARDLGGEVVEVSLGMTRYAIAAYYLIANAEASSNLARYDGVRYGRRVFGEDLETTYRRTRSEGFGPEARRRILLGTYALSAGYYEAYYGRALQVRRRIREEMAAILREVDLIVGPTSPETAFPLGVKVADPLSMYLSDIYTVPASLGGYPALSLPCGLEAGLPVGLQIVGRPFEEDLLLRAAAALERALGFRLAPKVMA